MSSIELGGDELLGILEVLDGIQLTREEVGHVQHLESVSLRDEAFEG